MQLQSMRDNEKVGNNVLFAYCCAIAVAGWAAVALFLNGGLRECTFLFGIVLAILTKVFEKKLGNAAKYVYACIPPVMGAITCSVCSTSDSDSFVCITHYYMAATVLLVLYLDMQVIKVNAIVTVVLNTVCMILFPAGFLKLHKLIGWVFILLFYLILFAGCMFICYRTNMLFGIVENKEKNLESVLNEVQSISEDLYSAGSALSSISENESASAEELAATSEQLLESSNLLSERTKESMSNLGELEQWENVVAENVEKVEITSKDLLEKSQENARLLNDLHTINDEVSQSMNITIDMAESLSEAVNEIGVTLKLINEISSSTNLLALNASIEAARAGEAGRGFAVVATEVGNLANSTRESLGEVQSVIERVQNNVNKITTHIEENARKLTTQNEYYNNVFKSMQDMTDLLNDSVAAINTMGDAHNKQSGVIKNTVSINQNIAESIKSENEQFNAINAMTESNANDITDITVQANKINGMVDEMGKLLKRGE